MRNNTRTQAGFSLIELMIAVVIMGIVTAQLFVVMGNQKKVYSSNERAVDTQETARMTLDLISFDTRLGGYMVQPWDAVSSFDGGTTDPDRFCVSSAFADPGVDGDDNPMHGLIKRFPGAVVKVIGGNSVDVDVLDIDKDGNPDFLTGGGVIVASKRESYCGRVKTAVPNGSAFTITFENNDSSGKITSTAGSEPDELRAVPANVYELNKDTLELQRNGMLLASQIEDFQVEYWVDGAGGGAKNIDDGDTEFPINDLNTPDPPNGGITAQNDRIRRVRITVLAVAPLEDQANSAAGHLSFGRPKIANRVAAAASDRLRRRAFSASIMPRNVIDEE